MTSTATTSAPAKQPSGSPSQGRGSTQPRILRACVVQAGKVIEEQRLRKREPLTIGQGAKNSFVVAEKALPRSHKLFTVRGGQYELVLTENMRGKISAANDPNPVDFATLKAQGLLKKRGNYYHLPLNEGHRGKVIIGDTTLIFQFVVPPPTPAKPQLPAAARGSFWKQIDWPYALALVAIAILEAPLIVYFHYAPEPQRLSIETMGDRWAKLIAPDIVKKPDKPKPKPDKGKSKSKSGKKKKVAKKDTSKSKPKKKQRSKKARAARSKKIRDKIAGKGVLAILGAKGSKGGGAVADVFGKGDVGGDLDSAFDGISGVGMATESNQRTKRGGGSGKSASIGGLATKGGGKVGLGGKKEKRVGTAKASAPSVDGKLDPSAIARVVRSRMRMVQDCYERELKRNPELAGKIEVEFTIGTSGRITDAWVITNTMGSETVGSCIVGRLRRWRFPRPDGGSVTVSFPFIFTPSS